MEIKDDGKGSSTGSPKPASPALGGKPVSPALGGKPVSPALGGQSKSPQPAPQPSGNKYVMTAEVKNGINVRAEASSESKLMYMLAKVDPVTPLITITKMSPDNKWGFMDTGDPEKNGWLFLEYLRKL